MNNNLEQKLIDLEVTNDLIFQKIFGKVGNEQITKGFLEAILGIQIKSISLDKNKRMQLDKLDNKTGRLDIKAELDDGTIVHIEVQTKHYKYMEKRLLYYNDELYVERLKISEDYKKINKVISILIYESTLNATKEIPKFHTVWNFREKDYHNKVLAHDTEIHVIELPKFKNNAETELENNWINFINIKEMSQLEEIKDLDESIKKAKEELKYLASNPELQEEYKARAKELRDFISFSSAEREEGIEEGIEEGVKKGIKEGKKEVARQMKLKNIPIEDIVELTKLSKEEVENL